MNKTILSGLLGGLLMMGTAWAQTTTTTGTATVTTSSSTGAFTQLSPGNQAIAQALFDAQTPPIGTKPLTLDQIAAMKQSGEGWGEIFHQMRENNLTSEKNLGDVVSDFRHAEIEQRQGVTVGGGHVHSHDTDDVTVTTGLGHTESSGSVSGHGSAAAQGHHSADVTVTSGFNGGGLGGSHGIMGGSHSGGGGGSHGGGRH